MQSIAKRPKIVELRGPDQRDPSNFQIAILKARRRTRIKRRGEAGTGGSGDNVICTSPRLPFSPFFRASLTLARTGGFGLPVFVAQDRLPRKFDLVALAADALDQDLLAFLELVADVLHPPVRDLRNVQ